MKDGSRKMKDVELGYWESGNGYLEFGIRDLEVEVGVTKGKKIVKVMSTKMEFGNRNGDDSDSDSDGIG